MLQLLQLVLRDKLLVSWVDRVRCTKRKNMQAISYALDVTKSHAAKQRLIPVGQMEKWVQKCLDVQKRWIKT